MVADRRALDHRPARRDHPVSLWHRVNVSVSHFGRVYAAYGGWFVVLSILWGWQVDRIAPDRFDLIGGLVCLVGVA